MSTSKKQKLTLSVNREVVQKARKVGLNLSEITEKVLRGFTAIPSESNQAEVVSHYKLLLDSMLPLMKLYDIRVQVGSEDDYDDEGNTVGAEPYYLDADGDIVKELMNNDIQIMRLEEIPSYVLFDPNRILSSFIDNLSNAKQRNQETIDRLQLTKRIIEVMTESIGKRPESGERKTGKAGTDQTSGNRALQPLPQSTKAQPLPRE